VPLSFPDAARRSWTDAEQLLNAGRSGTPDHLYGLAAECALKAILAGLGAFLGEPPPRSPYRRHINHLWAEYATFMSASRARIGLLPPSTPPGHPAPFAAWDVVHRYFDDGTFALARVAAHRADASVAMELFERAVVNGVVT
jgi:hypothetical protein